MLLLLNHRSPALGAVVGFVVGLAMVTLGVVTGSSMMMVWGAPSVALAIVRGAHNMRGQKSQR
jgi:hypothetical protein